MPERRLVVTVGTSLLSSASWRAEGRLLEVRGYGEWLEPEYLKEPNNRRTEGWQTALLLADLLADATPAAMAQSFEWDPYAARRYSAELTTLVRLWEWEQQAEDPQSFEDFLRRYGQIDLVAPSRLNDPARVAANHLSEILGTVLGHPRCEVREVLTSRFLTERIEGFSAYLQRLPEGPVDLLVTGAYKAFSLVAGLMTARRPGAWRLVYLHEKQESELVLGEATEDGEWIQSTSTGRTHIQLTSPSPVDLR